MCSSPIASVVAHPTLSSSDRLQSWEKSVSLKTPGPSTRQKTLIVTMIGSLQSQAFIYTSSGLPETPTPDPSLPASMPALAASLLKSVPVSWARMRKERDWVVPVRGCQSSVSWISLFLLRSLGIKQGKFSTLRPCLHTHPAAPQGRQRLT